MAKKAPAKPAAKRRSLNTIVDAAPQIAELAKRMEAERARIIAEMAAEEEAKKTPMQPAVVAPTESIAWRPWLRSGAKAVALIVCGMVTGIYAAGGIEVGPGPLPADSVSAVFDTQESAFRSLSGERAKALRRGEIKSEADSAAWMSSRFIPQAEAAWIVLLTEETKAFGGEQWTAEKEASHIERYAR